MLCNSKAEAKSNRNVPEDIKRDNKCITSAAVYTHSNIWK